MRRSFCIALALAAMFAPLCGEAQAALLLPAGSNDLPLQVQDADGKVLGRALWLGDKWLAVMQGTTQAFAVPLAGGVDEDYTHLDFSRLGTLYYETTDCSGPAYLPAPPFPTALRSALAIHSEGRFLLFVASGVAGPVSVGSQRQAPRICRANAGQLTLAPVVETIDVTDAYRKPLSIR